MSCWIALVRGINVGPANRLPMTSLAGIFEQAGCKRVTTYIASGNVVFDATIRAQAPFEERIGLAIEKAHGFRPAVRLIDAASLEDVIAANPYPEAVSAPTTLHVIFLAEKARAAGLTAAKRLAAPTERFEAVGTALYLHAPNGIARSRFVKGIDRALAMSTTARNWKTVTKLAEIAAARVA